MEIIMTMNEVANYLDNKVEEKQDLVKITFYDLRVKYNLTEEETKCFLQIAKNKFENMNYKVYFTGSDYMYKNNNMIVTDNELMVAVRDNYELIWNR